MLDFRLHRGHDADVADADRAAGWYPDSPGPGLPRWWDGSQWTDLRAAPSAPELSERKERLWAAASHFGLPFGGPVAPLIVWSAAPVGSFRREHARRSFSFQLVYLAFHVIFVMYLVFWGPDGPLLICVLVGFLLQLPQVFRALSGRPPLPFPPFLILKQ